jgi:hypothetical protein
MVPAMVSANHIQVLASEFDSSFGIVARHKSRVIIEGQIALPPETVVLAVTCVTSANRHVLSQCRKGHR